MWTFILAALLEGGLAFGTSRGLFNPALAGPIAKGLVVILVGYGLWHNQHLRSMWLVALGLLSNSLVIAANGGHMPVSLKAAEQAGLPELLVPLQNKADAVHSLMTPESPLWFLGDIIPMHVGNYHKILSLGDLFLLLGIVLIGIEGSLQAKRKREAELEAGLQT